MKNRSGWALWPHGCAKLPSGRSSSGSICEREANSRQPLQRPQASPAASGDWHSTRRASVSATSRLPIIGGPQNSVAWPKWPASIASAACA